MTGQIVGQLGERVIRGDARALARWAVHAHRRGELFRLDPRSIRLLPDGRYEIKAIMLIRRTRSHQWRRWALRSIPIAVFLAVITGAAFAAAWAARNLGLVLACLLIVVTVYSWLARPIMKLWRS